MMTSVIVILLIVMSEVSSSHLAQFGLCSCLQGNDCGGPLDERCSWCYNDTNVIPAGQCGRKGSCIVNEVFALPDDACPDPLPLNDQPCGGLSCKECRRNTACSVCKFSVVSDEICVRKVDSSVSVYPLCLGSVACPLDSSYVVQPSCYADVNEDGQIVGEAERFSRRFFDLTVSLHQWIVVPQEGTGIRVVDSGAARGSGVIQLLPDVSTGEKLSPYQSASPTIDYEINVRKTGIYKLFVRTLTQNSGRDSLYAMVVEIDDGNDDQGNTTTK